MVNTRKIRAIIPELRLSIGSALWVSKELLVLGTNLCHRNVTGLVTSGSQGNVTGDVTGDSHYVVTSMSRCGDLLGLTNMVKIFSMSPCILLDVTDIVTL